MSWVEILVLVGALGPVVMKLFKYVFILIRTLYEATQTTTAVTRLKNAFDVMQLDVNEHSIRISRLEQTTEKHEARLNQPYSSA